MAHNVETVAYLNKYVPDKSGQCSVSVKITYERERKYYQTGIRLSPESFERVMASRPRKELKETRAKIDSFVRKAQEIVSNMAVFTFSLFEKQYFQNRGASDTVFSAFEKYVGDLRNAGRVGTAASYDNAKSSLEKFAPKVRFADIDKSFLMKYENWMRERGRSQTTTGIYTRSLRTIFNEAIHNGQIDRTLYPFGRREYEPPTSRNIKKALTTEEIASIYNYNCRTEAQEIARDYWLFLYLCNGMNVKDFCLLKWEDIDGNILSFVREKTKLTKREEKPISVDLKKDAWQIIKKCGVKNISDKGYIFPYMEPNATPERQIVIVKNVTHVINDHMKEIAEDLKINKVVTTYAARHSFATVLRNTGSSVEFISEMLGHTSVNTTKSYLASFEQQELKKNTDRLSDFKKKTVSNKSSSESQH